MSVTQEQIKSLESRLTEAWRVLNLDEYPDKIADLEKQMTAKDFWNDQNKAKAVSQQAADLKQELETWQKMKDELVEAQDVAALAQAENNQEVLTELEINLESLDQRLRTLELNTLFSGKYDNNNAIVSIHAGAGGTDAMDWAGMLLRMFSRFVEKHGWQMAILDQSEGEEAGFKSVTFRVSGRRAFGYFKSEAGVHRLVRISPFDAEKMRHTSFALAEVIPELDELTEKQLEIDPKDLRIDTFMASGKGGQSVNTTYSAVRLTHIPTNIVVSCQNERSQSQNKETAMRILKSRLFARLQEERAEKLEELRGKHKSPEWGNQIRSYVLQPYKMVKDHRTNFETQDVEAVLGGELDNFVESYLRSQVANLQLNNPQ